MRGSAFLSLLCGSRCGSMCRIALLVLLVAVLPAFGRAASSVKAAVPFGAIPAEVRSLHFTVAVNGRRTPVLHAAGGYYLLNFDVAGPAVVQVTAEDPHFWDRGVEVQPMRYGIRPRRRGATITFPIPGPVKLSLSRPGEHFAESEMLFLFGNEPEMKPVTEKTPGVRYFGPGVHRENIDAHDGERIYLAPGAVVFGSLNIWQVHDVRVFGTGTIIYDGPQDPHSDEGWMHKPNWHCIVMDQATNIEVDGITCITRSRSWQVQMKDSRHIGFYNVKVIGGNPNNANQDGLDWLGGGDTTVSHSFFRASDDVFALQGNWEGYELDKITKPGHDVTNISISDTVASTSISNTIRVAWPQKTFNSAHFHMRDMDVIHSGFGGCKVPFAFFELWADPDGHGAHSDYSFEKIRIEDWYSLFQIRQPAPQVRDVRFAEVWAMDGPGMLPSVVKGDVRGVSVQGTQLGGVVRAKPVVMEGASAPVVQSGGVPAGFAYTGGVLRPHAVVQFTADVEEQPGRSFEWLFGDGTRASGRSVSHRFPDVEGTLLDGSGRFRVLLHVRDASGEEAWGSQSVVLGERAQVPLVASASDAGEGVFSGSFEVPEDGGYTLTLLTSTKASMAIDGRMPVVSPRAQPQVCGSVGDAVQPVRDSTVLAKGRHFLRITRSKAVENAEVPAGGGSDLPIVLWEGPGIQRQVLVLTR